MDDENDWIILRYLAEAIVSLENRSDQREAEQYLRTIFSDLRSNSSKRGVVTVFAKQISCNCLTEKCEEAKQQHVKMGQCYNCKKIFEFKSLKNCARCKIAHYCSTECQQSDWRRHKEGCAPRKQKGQGKVRHQSQLAKTEI